MGTVYEKSVREFLALTETKEFFVFDTETTGLSAAENDIIQFSAVMVKREGKMYNILKQLDLYINPGYHIPEEITGITGITDEMVKDAPDAAEAAKQIAEFLGENPVLVGYNSMSFDQKFMDALYKKHVGRAFGSEFHLDVLKMAREMCEKPHKLCNMAERAGVADKYAFHSSIEDVKATLDVLAWLIPQYDRLPKASAAITITRIAKWHKSETLSRIYVNNDERKTVYYDLCCREWCIDASLDAQSVIAQVLAYAGAADEQSFAAMY